ncbi:Formamide amidohydrolase [Saitozyma sp. JCM 24511]|nr:Formamide amidohydrolase [Saitozyma sp. JCM 24511]
MSIRSIPTLVKVDPHGVHLRESNVHNRWHPEIPAVARAQPGQAFKVECMDFTGNFFQNSDTADDILEYDWNTDHHLSGPVAIDSAEPGDVLVVDILETGSGATQSPQVDSCFLVNHRLTSAQDPGLGPLDKAHTKVAKSIWDFEGVKASSRHVPGVEFCGRPHPGVIGTAPSKELLAVWESRERGINERYVNHGHICAIEPSSSGAFVGQDLPQDLMDKIRNEGARTKPAREHGGNIDSASLTRGSRIYLPVFVQGANLSVGDLHFSQGDGEPTCALEMAGTVTLKCTVLKSGMEKLKLKAPIVLPSPAEPLYRNQVVFHGLSVDEDGVQQKSSLTTAYIAAAWNAMDHLQRVCGYSHEQAYMIMAVAPIESRVLAVPNIPTANVSVGLPIDIFDVDIRPSIDSPPVEDRSAACAYLTPERLARLEKEHKPGRTPFRDYDADQVNGSS